MNEWHGEHQTVQSSQSDDPFALMKLVKKRVSLTVTPSTTTNEIKRRGVSCRKYLPEQVVTLQQQQIPDH